MSLFGDGLELLKLVDVGHNAPLYMQLGTWIEKVGELQKKNDELTTENADLKEQIRFKGSLERINGHIFVVGDDEEICPRCAEVDLKLVHLMQVRTNKPPYLAGGCPACNTTTMRGKALKRSEAAVQQQ